MKRFLWFLVVCGGFGGFRCSSAPTRDDVFAQVEANEDAEKTVEKYIPKGQDRDTVIDALRGSSRVMVAVEKDRARAVKTAESNAKAASKWRWLLGIGGTLIFLLGVKWLAPRILARFFPPAV